MDLDALAHVFVGSEQNLAVNPRFEAGALPMLTLPPTGAAQWSLTALSGVVSDNVIEGSYSLRLAGGDRVAVAVLPVTPGQFVSVGVDVGLASTTGSPQIAWFDASGAAVALGALYPSPGLYPDPGLYPTSGAAMITTAGYQGVAPSRVGVSGPAPPFTAWGVCQLVASGANTTSATFDRVIASLTPAPLPFFDGDSGACAWTGQRYWSTSQRLGAADELESMIESCAAYWSSDSPLVTAQPNPISTVYS
jgi:hypothetical protein